MPVDDGFPRLPPNFERWTTPWHISMVASLNEEGRLVEWQQWTRTYIEQSHCGTPGCCQLTYSIFGPELSEPAVVQVPEQPAEGER